MSKRGQEETNTQHEKKYLNKFFFFFQIFSEGKKTLREQAGTGGTHQPELTIFWDFYFTEGGGRVGEGGREGYKTWREKGKVVIK